MSAPVDYAFLNALRTGDLAWLEIEGWSDTGHPWVMNEIVKIHEVRRGTSSVISIQVIHKSKVDAHGYNLHWAEEVVREDTAGFEAESCQITNVTDLRKLSPYAPEPPAPPQAPPAPPQAPPQAPPPPPPAIPRDERFFFGNSNNSEPRVESLVNRPWIPSLGYRGASITGDRDLIFDPNFDSRILNPNLGYLHRTVLPENIIIPTGPRQLFPNQGEIPHSSNTPRPEQFDGLGFINQCEGEHGDDLPERADDAPGLDVPPESVGGLDAFGTQRARLIGSICAESDVRNSSQTSGWPMLSTAGSRKKSLRPTKTAMGAEIKYRRIASLGETTDNLDVSTASWDDMYNWLRNNERTENVIALRSGSEKKRFIASKDGVRLANAMVHHWTEFSDLSAAMTRAGKDQAKIINKAFWVKIAAKCNTPDGLEGADADVDLTHNLATSHISDDEFNEHLNPGHRGFHWTADIAKDRFNEMTKDMNSSLVNFRMSGMGDLAQSDRVQSSLTVFSSRAKDFLTIVLYYLYSALLSRNLLRTMSNMLPEGTGASSTAPTRTVSGPSRHRRLSGDSPPGRAIDANGTIGFGEIAKALSAPVQVIISQAPSREDSEVPAASSQVILDELNVKKRTREMMKEFEKDVAEHFASYRKLNEELRALSDNECDFATLIRGQIQMTKKLLANAQKQIDEMI